MSKRIPRKTKDGKIRPASKHSDLYTDENPSDTVSIAFATPADARATVRKVKKYQSHLPEKYKF